MAELRSPPVNHPLVKPDRMATEDLQRWLVALVAYINALEARIAELEEA